MLARNRSGHHGGEPPQQPARRRPSWREPVVVSREAVVGGKSTWIYEFHVPCHSAPGAVVEPDTPDDERPDR